jgi:hypothetical protein
MNKYHYVYYSYEEWGRGYIGSRSCSVLPQEDLKYFGSFYDKSFKPTCKVVLATFDTRKEAIAAEIRLHEFYQVDKNKHFANQAKQTSWKFIFSGPRSLEFRQNVSKRLKGRKLTSEHIKKVSEARSKKLKGRPLSDAHKKSISIALKGKTKGKKYGKRLRKDSKMVILKNLETNEIFEFPSISRASEATGIARANIYALIKNPNYKAKGFVLVEKDPKDSG